LNTINSTKGTKNAAAIDANRRDRLQLAKPNTARPTVGEITAQMVVTTNSSGLSLNICPELGRTNRAKEKMYAAPISQQMIAIAKNTAVLQPEATRRLFGVSGL
jgi:hypothetical protein